MPKQTNPANLTSSTVVITTATKKITVQTGGAGATLVDSGGVTLQCLYSYLKQQWKTDAALIKFPFPMVAITAEQFEFVDGWDLANQTSKDLIRDGGWALKDVSNNVLEIYMNVTTLGNFNDPVNDKAYYQQSSSGSAIDAVYSGPVNQAVKIFGGVSNGNFDYTTYFKIFLRVQGKTYDFYDLISSQNLTTLDYRKYAMPLSNGIDLNIATSDVTIAGTAPYTGITVTYITANIRGAWVTATSYAIGDVVQQTGRWYRCTTAHTSSASFATDQATRWTAYAGERQIGSSYYAFRVIINGNNAIAEKIYEKVQYMLRQNTNIDTGASVIGKTASTLLYFVGSTLTTQPGVYVDNFIPADTNRINFYDYLGTLRQFPYVASGQILFNNNLVNDTVSATPAIYKMFFTTNPAGNFGTSNALIVQDKTGTNIEGTVSGSVATNGYVSFTFDYDGNAQGGRTPATDASVTVVAIGARTAQYVSQVATITRSTANVVQLVSALERNYNGL